jgi:hypothetical protein
MRSELWDTPCARLLQCLALDQGSTQALHDACVRALQAGGVPFEVVVGAPADIVRPRITFAAPHRRAALARALGLSPHWWGPPDTVGVRPDWAKGVEVRGYHRLTRVPSEIRVPVVLRGRLHPIMAAPAPEPELYAQWIGPPGWDELRSTCQQTTGLVLPEPQPRPTGDRGMLGLSLRTGPRGAIALTAYADHTALPPDPEIRAAWGESLSATDRDAFERALAVVRSLGARQGGSWFDVLAWGVDATGRTWQAASLRVPWPGAVDRPPAA